MMTKNNTQLLHGPLGLVLFSLGPIFTQCHSMVYIKLTFPIMPQGNKRQTTKQKPKDRRQGQSLSLVLQDPSPSLCHPENSFMCPSVDHLWGPSVNITDIHPVRLSSPTRPLSSPVLPPMPFRYPASFHEQQSLLPASGRMLPGWGKMTTGART